MTPFLVSGFFGVALILIAVGSWRTRPSLVQLLSKARAAPQSVLSGQSKPVELIEIALLLEILPLLLRGGLGVIHSLTWIADRSTGQLTQVIRETLRDLEFGDSVPDVLNRFGLRLGGSAGRELAQKLKIAIDRGNRLADMLESQAEGIKGQLRAERIAESGKRENQILLPLVFLVLPVTIAFAMYPSITALSQLA